jgi:xanthine dehydrogenase YagT iron-sulfur-binding subunit
MAGARSRPPDLPSEPPESTPGPSGGAVSRRGLLRAAGVAAATAALDGCAAAMAPAPPAEAPAAGVPLSLTVNGARQTVNVEPRTTLLSLLRNHLDVTGPKEVCDRGACGACSVLVDGVLLNACMLLALDCAGKTVTTAEGLARGDQLDPVQEAFWYHDGMQCGYCTPGFVVAIRAVLNRNPKATRAEIQAGCAGNLCRCGAYPRIFDAALAVAGGEKTEVLR